jgi:hypothetical protein
MRIDRNASARPHRDGLGSSSGGRQADGLEGADHLVGAGVEVGVLLRLVHDVAEAELQLRVGEAREPPMPEWPSAPGDVSGVEGLLRKNPVPMRLG